jgi:ketopantoate reductase
VELGITFYPAGNTRQDDKNQPPKLDVKVVMPKTWATKMYVAALSKYIKRHLILS